MTIQVNSEVPENIQAIVIGLYELAKHFNGEVDLVAVQPTAAATPTKRRGRPVAGETPAAQTPAPAVTAAVVEADPFDTGVSPALDVAPATLDDVRAAMKALAAATTQDNALKVLKEAGGVANLTELQRTPEKYGAVVAAAKAVKVKAFVAEPEPADPFETAAPAAAPEQAAPSKEDVKAALVKAQKRTGVDIVQAVVMKHGGKAAGDGGKVGPSLTALPISAYATVIKEVGDLPTTK